MMEIPLLINHPGALAVFRSVAEDLPKYCEVYLLGGAIRNALLNNYKGERLKQRDYDQICTQNSKVYIDYLRSEGFLDGDIVHYDQIIMYKALVPNLIQKSYVESIVFDIHPDEGNTALNNLERHTGFTQWFRTINERHICHRLAEPRRQSSRSYRRSQGDAAPH